MRVAWVVGVMSGALYLGCGPVSPPPPPECEPKSCAALGANCGTVGDGCGGTLSCGSCGEGQTCGGGGTANVCGAPSCTPTTCAALGANCGPVGDGCGGTLNCGRCSGTDTCGGGGAPNVCGQGTCTPTTCAALGANCGMVGDGCGGTLSCGSCSGGQSCGGGGTPNVCGAPAETGWLKVFSTPGPELFTDVATQSDGLVVTLTNADQRMMKFNKQGEELWRRPALVEGRPTDYQWLASRPSDGKLLAAGSQIRTGPPDHVLDLWSADGTTLTQLGHAIDTDSFHSPAASPLAMAWAKSGYSGTCLFHRDNGGAEWSRCNPNMEVFISAVAIDSHENVLFAAFTITKTNFDGVSIGREGGRTTVIGKYKRDGTRVWLKEFNGDLAIDELGASALDTVVALGDARADAYWGSERLGDVGPVLLVMEADGTPRFWRDLPGSSPGGLAVLPAGQAAVSVVVDCQTLAVLRYNLAGDKLWERRAHATSCPASGKGFYAGGVVFQGNSVIASGGIYAPATFGDAPAVHTPQGDSDAFLWNLGE